ncbi:diguanylate cyclase (GGDEF) domain-containing protein [Ectothiorhodospira magna]|uniref:diguanylate cyclase n=1 Tax=Ectothiorhodospira magna TaxID=867345 RepID=A0A1H9BHT0_9GAMM|nr:GGDEF domain-containing protein [Ectothiorhodospira magna]SEP88287.1 diguanylate cyclase (GGDEF) domain-containing protein [Ectothiorhodospira magna]
MIRHIIQAPVESSFQAGTALACNPRIVDHEPVRGQAPAPEVVSTPVLLHRLQTTLDLNELIEIFSSAIAWRIPHDGLTFDREDMGIHLSRGRLSRHSCRYNLVVDHAELGEIRLLRGRKFRDMELEALEEALTALVYPLRNALLYHAALRAAETDTLTGLQNRSAMNRAVERELALSRRSGQPLAMLVLDVDHFKHINDRYGHHCGDQVLMAVAQRLREVTRKSDMVFRFGGEEFVILMAGTDADAARQGAMRVQEALRAHPLPLGNGDHIPVTASIGGTLCRDEDTPHSLFQRADQSMYRAKQTGRNRIEWAD